MSRWDVFSQLPPPQNRRGFTVAAGTERIRTAKGHPSSAAFLINFDHSASSTPRRLMHLSYSPAAPVELTSLDGERRLEQLAILECHSADLDLQRYFFQ